MEYEDISSLLVKAVTNFSSRQHHLISFMDVQRTNSQQVQKVMFFKKGTDYPMFPTSLLQYRSLSRYTPLNSLVSTCQVHFLNPSFFPSSFSP